MFVISPSERHQGESKVQIWTSISHPVIMPLGKITSPTTRLNASLKQFTYFICHVRPLALVEARGTMEPRSNTTQRILQPLLCTSSRCDLLLISASCCRPPFTSHHTEEMSRTIFSIKRFTVFIGKHWIGRIYFERAIVELLTPNIWNMWF